MLPTGARAYANVRWLAPTRPGGPARDGEIDLLLVQPEHGLLVIETKGGSLARDRLGRWYAGHRALEVSPFQQAETAKHALARLICAHPRWSGDPPRMLHAVAAPEIDRLSLGRAPGTSPTALGPDAPLELLLDRADLARPEATAAALERIFAFWSGDGSRNRTLSEAQLAIIAEVLAPEAVLRPLLAGDLEAGERALVTATDHQLTLLETLRSVRRASIVGGAGSGKTLVAAEKARRLAAAGFEVLLVCFNAPLARALADDPELRKLVALGRLTVSTFHQLCRRLAAEAGTLPPQPAQPDREWFERVLPGALDAAIPRLGQRWRAVIVDEGQDFEAGWLVSLDLLLAAPGEDVFYLFHDPAQALYRADETAALGLAEFPLPLNCRNARPIHDFAYRWYTGDVPADALRDDGREPEIVVAEPGAPTLDALRHVLSQLVKTERIAPERIAVLTGVSLEHSTVWRQGRFRGGLTLWNGGVDEAGRPMGRPFDALPAQPPGTIAIDSIYRFKGLERDVVVLVELRPADPRLGMLLYIGSSRAKHHLVIVAPEEIVARLGSDATNVVGGGARRDNLGVTAFVEARLPGPRNKNHALLTGPGR